MKKWFIVPIILVLFGLILIGCKDKTQDTAKSETSATAPAMSTTPEVKMGGDLRLCSTNPTTLFPARMRSYVDYVSSAPALEALAHYDKAGNMVPWLATGWEIDNAANTITLTLKKGVKFHDGTDFNAEAVKWNLDLFASEKREETLSVKSVEVIDENTVQYCCWH